MAGACPGSSQPSTKAVDGRGTRGHDGTCPNAQEAGMRGDLRYEVCDRIAEINLSRPPVNALSLSLLEQLIAALRRAAAHDEGRAVVLTRSLAHPFNAGSDLAALTSA